MKNIIGVYSAPKTHWVGNGFPVRSLFSYNTHGKSLNPFLLLDRAGPAEFAPSNERRGVGQHPHRGFETVTIVYKGEVAHRDSTGEGGIIGSGDVQWMTAAAGILHEEYHSDAFSREGGTLDMVQLWVNLPAKDKMASAGYQSIKSKDIPTLSLMDEAGTVRVIAGEYKSHKGPAQTFTPMTVLDIKLNPGVTVNIPATEGWSTAIIVLSGSVEVNDNTTAHEADLIVLSHSQSDFSVRANNHSSLLLLSGEPIEEPVIGYGPFVMNSEDEIIKAVEDFNSGRFGNIH